MRAVVGWLCQLVCWLALLTAGALISVAVVVPRLGGATPYAVETGSMRPGHPPGTLVVVRPVPIEEIVIGDVVTYQLRSGEPTVVTHRVVGIRTAPDGTRSLITRGDANDVPDAAPVRDVQIEGRLWYALPYLGYVTNALTSSQRRLAVYVAAALLGCYAAAMFAGSARDRRRPPGAVAHHREKEVSTP